MLSRYFYARQLIRYTALPGRVRLAMLGSPERLIRRGRIGAYRRIQADGPSGQARWT